MKKNNISPIQIDPITGEYQITIPEWIMTELGWYEDTEISMIIEGSELILAEK